jgi:Tol biopolymer transport system component
MLAASSRPQRGTWARTGAKSGGNRMMTAIRRWAPGRHVFTLILAWCLALAGCSSDVPGQGPGQPADQSARTERRNGRIAFILEPRTGIHQAGPDGRQVGQLVDDRDANWATWMAWSPDGRRLAYVVQFKPGIRLATADGVRERTLVASDIPQETVYSRPSWSPDGRRLVFSALFVPPGAPQEDYRQRLYRLDVDTGEFTQLTDDDMSAWHPAWSPAGDRIAFVKTTGDEPGTGTVEIAVVDDNGREMRQLADVEFVPNDLTWSPDGRTIAYSSLHGEIHLIDTDGGGPRRSVNIVDQGYKLFPLGMNLDWSPDGRRLIFTAADESSRGPAIYIMNADGTGIRRMTAGCCAAWQALPN